MAELVLNSVCLWAGSRAVHPIPGQEEHRIVSDIDLTVPAGQSVALIGESGAGKTSLALAIMGLWPGRASGEIHWGDRRLDELGAADYAALRGRELVLLLQDPMAALNPSLTAGTQLREVLRLRRGLTRPQARDEALVWLERVGLEPPRKIAASYPHQLSGGMAQRVLIAMALACGPKLLIADEPFSALDAATAADHLRLLREMREEYGFSLLLITHDLGLAADLCSSVVVLRNGSVVEQGDVTGVFEQPQAKYTRELIEASGLRVATI